MCLTPRSDTIVSTGSVGLLPEIKVEIIREGEPAIEYFYGEWDGADSLTVLL